MSFKNYIENLQLEQLFVKLKVPNASLLAKEVDYFTTKEAEKRDKIVLSYFGKEGINRIIDTICTFLFAPPKLPINAKVLDVGAGTGFFTAKVYNKVRQKLLNVCFYAMDATPAMLACLERKQTGIIPFVGVAENIKGSVKEARKYFKIPSKFDAILSTLMLHHSAEPEKVFKSIKETLKSKGKAVVIDLCKHNFKEFKMEMGDIHLGFDLESIKKLAEKSFSSVKIEKIGNVGCECSGRIAEIFAAFLINNP